MPTWYLILWVIVLLLAVFTKSLVASLAMLFVWGLGYYLALGLEEYELIRVGIAGMFVLGMGFTAMEMVTKVDRI